ncbi:SAM-dependent methyltransferase [Nocardia fluminea]
MHDIAEQRSDTARTLYVDSDIVAATHGRAMLHEPPTRFFTDTDFTDTDAILGDITTVMDMSAPLTVCMSNTAEWISDAPAVLAALTDRLPVGTWLVFTHVTAMLAGYQLLQPGLIAPHRWAPTPNDDNDGGDGGDGDVVRQVSATAPRHRAAWDLSAYAAIGQRCRN